MRNKTKNTKDKCVTWQSCDIHSCCGARSDTRTHTRAHTHTHTHTHVRTHTCTHTHTHTHVCTHTHTHTTHSQPSTHSNTQSFFRLFSTHTVYPFPLTRGISSDISRKQNSFLSLHPIPHPGYQNIITAFIRA